MNTTIFFSKLLLDAFRDTYKVYNYFNLKKNNNFFIFFPKPKLISLKNYKKFI